MIQLSFIMKNQNLDEIMQELFDQQIKLTPKNKFKKEHFLLKIPLFDLIYQKKGDNNFQIIVSNIKLIKVDFGEIIFRNQDQRSFNYILQGSILLFTREKNEEKKQVAKLYKRLEVGQYFGQKMQYGKQELQRAQSAETKTYLLQLPMNIFYHTFSGHFKYQQLRDKINFLKSIWIFNQVKRGLLQKILLSSDSQKIIRNSILVHIGDQPTVLYVIIEGQLTMSIFKDGKFKAFCVLGKGQVCGLDQIIEEKSYDYTVKCTSDYAEILKVDKQIVIGIVDRDIKPELLKKRRQLAIKLRQKKIDTKKLLLWSQKQLDTSQNSFKEYRLFSHRKRYKSEGGAVESFPPPMKIKPLNQLFDRQLQLKQSQLRRYKLQQIEQAQKSINYTNRISTYTNNSCTYDREIIVKYLGRKQKKYQDILRKEREFIQKRIVLVPQLKVQKSSAVKNQKRKLKRSRKQFYSTLQIYD